MRFNADKCVLPRLHRRQAKNNNVQYQLNGEILSSVSRQRDFDVIVERRSIPIANAQDERRLSADKLSDWSFS